jgi:hypothetical protein
MGAYARGDWAVDEAEAAMAALGDSPTFWVPEPNMEKFEARIVALDKRSQKLGCGPVGFAVIAKEERPVEGYSKHRGWKIGSYVLMTCYQVVVRGEAPAFKGWSFLGTIDFTDPAVTGYALRMVPGQRIPPRWQDMSAVDPAACDHCHTRRQRSYTYLVQHEDGRVQQVGSSCLKDFLGINASPESIAKLMLAWHDVSKDIDSLESSGGGHKRISIDLVEFLAGCILYSDVHGYVSAKAAREADEQSGKCVQTTSDAVFFRLAGDWVQRGDKAWEDECRRFQAAITDEDRKLARDMLAWLKTQPADNDYMQNMHAYTGTGLASWASKGYAASLVALYRREQAKRAVKAPVGSAGWVAKPGDRVQLTGCVVTQRSEFEGNYGMTTILKWRTPGDESCVWFASRPPEAGIRPGVTIDVTGTIDKHTTYKGQKETSLKRCMITVR